MSGTQPPVSPPPASPPPDEPPSNQLASAAADPPPARYEVTVHTNQRTLAGVESPPAVSDLDLDRVPDPAGGVRVLVDDAEIARLIDRGYEVRLQQAIPVQPLDPALIATDYDVDSWVAQRMAGVAEPSSQRSSEGEPPVDERPAGDH